MDAGIQSRRRHLPIPEITQDIAKPIRWDTASRRGRGFEPWRREKEPEERGPEEGQRHPQVMSQIEDEQKTEIRREQRPRKGGRPQPAVGR